jgi:hypothetical protein
MTATPTKANSAILRVSMISSPAQSSGRTISSRRCSSPILNLATAAASADFSSSAYTMLRLAEDWLRMAEGWDDLPRAAAEQVQQQQQQQQQVQPKAREKKE